MARRQSFAVFLVVSLLANAFCLPPNVEFRWRRNLSDNKVNSDDTSLDDVGETTTETSTDGDLTALTSEVDVDDDDDFKTQPQSSGSNVFSLLNLASAFLPYLSNSNNNVKNNKEFVKKNNEFVKRVIRDAITRYQAQKIQKRQDVGDNVIEIDYATELKPPFFQRQESEENDDNDSEASESNSEDSEENNGAEESVEHASSENGGSKSKQDSASNASNDKSAASEDNDSDYDEPEGDGQGGGILGLLAGLSGEGESDLGSLLAAVGGIVANLSGDGVDINALIATGLGLFVGLLSDEGSNPGEIIASYILTSLDTITGGGAENNGQFFGKFLATLVKGTSAAGDDSGSASEENGGAMKMADSGGFLASLLMGLLGDMSKHSSGSWR